MNLEELRRQAGGTFASGRSEQGLSGDEKSVTTGKEWTRVATR